MCIPDSNGRELYVSAAINEALDEELARDENVVLIGEDIGIYGGAFGVTRGLYEKYGRRRIWETPISENSVVGAAVGAAMLGLRPVVEIMFMDFLALAMDQILNSAGKLHYMYDGQIRVPLVIRTPGGAKGGYGPSHSQMLTNMLLGIPGIRLVAPASAAMSKSLLKAAVRDDNPVIFIENKRLYGSRGPVPREDVVAELGAARVVAPGRHVSVFTYSAMVPLCLQLRQAFLKHDIDIEVVDLVSLQPLDKAALTASVEKTGRAVVVEEACRTGGIGAEVNALLAEECLDVLEAPLRRIGAHDVPIPAAVDQERCVLPDARDIANVIRETVEW